MGHRGWICGCLPNTHRQHRLGPGARPAILGSIWVIATTAVLAIPLGVAAAVQLEEFADKTKRFNHMIELNVQNLAAIPSVVYGLLALAVLTLLRVQNKNLVIAGATALACSSCR